jgi:CoA:oxalate CoA-transferase
MIEHGPLEHLSVVDLSEHLSGQYAARLMAAMGAQVTQIEPGGGSCIRELPPRGESNESYLFEVLSRGKRLVAVAEEAECSAAIRDATLMICGPAASAPLPGLRDAARITGLVTDFGESGPRAAWRGSEMIHQAIGGAMYVTGERKREPLYGCSYRAYFSAGLALFNGLLAALQVRDAAGEPVPQTVEVTVTETVAAMAQNGATQYNYNGSWQGRGEYPGLMERIKCADGWVVLFALRHWPELCAAFGLDHMATDPRFASPGVRQENWDTALAAFRAVAARTPADDLVERAQARKACVERMYSLDEVLASDHYAERGIFRTGQKVLDLGPAWRLSATPAWR